MWLPIETAPKTGELILVSGTSGIGDVVDVAFWDGNQWETYIFNVIDIFYWQPIPDAKRI